MAHPCGQLPVKAEPTGGIPMLASDGPVAGAGAGAGVGVLRKTSQLVPVVPVPLQLQ